jgi:hypothetical protein
VITTKNIYEKLNGGKNMESGNAIIIALIVIIIAVLGIFYFISGNGVTTQPDSQVAEPASSINTTQTNSNPTAPADSQSQASSSGSNAGPATSSASSDTSSQDTSDSSQDSSSQDTSDSSSGPQAGQAEGTYDPTDFD